MGIVKKLITKLALKYVMDYVKEAQGMAKGYKTTEFWLAVAGIVAQIWMAVAGLIPADLSAKVVGLVVVVYAIARAIVKYTPTKVDDAVLEDIVKKFVK